MQSKTCFQCEQLLPLDDFYRHPQMKDGHLNKCKECVKSSVRSNYARNHEHYRSYEEIRSQRPDRKANSLKYQKTRRQEFPEKDKARRDVMRALKNGTLVRKSCEVCGDAKSEAHHEDYSKPLDVRWLCFKHHREAHGQTVGIPF